MMMFLHCNGLKILKIVPPAQIYARGSTAKKSQGCQSVLTLDYCSKDVPKKIKVEAPS